MSAMVGNISITQAGISVRTPRDHIGPFNDPRNTQALRKRFLSNREGLNDGGLTLARHCHCNTSKKMRSAMPNFEAFPQGANTAVQSHQLTIVMLIRLFKISEWLAVRIAGHHWRVR